MATWADAERIGLALSATSIGTSWRRPTVQVNDTWFALDRGPRPHAVAQDDSGYFLTTDHFARSRMILVHLDQIPTEELAELMIDSWLIRASKRVAAEYVSAERLE